MQGLELKLHKDRFEYVVRNLSIRGYTITVKKGTFYITKNGYSNMANTEQGVILLSNRFL